MKNNKAEIFFSPGGRSVRQTAFFESLMKSNDLNHLTEIQRLPENYVNNFLNKNDILNALNQDSLLPRGNMPECKKVVNTLPEQFAVVKNIRKISVDFTIRRDKNIYFIEFHEQQHRQLGNKEIRRIYTTSFEEIKVPRFVQRLVRDVWRWTYLDNYQIIWYDWFKANPTDKVNLFLEGKGESSLQDKFSFKNFLNE